MRMLRWLGSRIRSIIDSPARRAEAVAEERLKTLQMLINATEEMIALLSKDFRFVAVNEYGSGTFGKKVKEVVGRRVEDVLPPDLSKNRILYGNEALKTGKSVQFEEQYQGRLYETRISPVFNEQGLAEHIAVFRKDVTERMQAEEELRAGRNRFKMVINHAPIVLWALDRDGIFSFVSGGKRMGILPTDPEAHVGRSIFELYADHPYPMAAARQALNGIEFSGEVEVGDRIWEVRYAPVKDSDGAPDGAIGIGIDVTSEKRARTALKESEARYRTLVNSSPIPILAHSEWNIVFANPAAVKAFGGSSPEDVVGKPILSFIHPEYHDLARKRIESVYKKEKPVEPAEMKSVRLDGSIMFIDAAISSIDYEGKPAAQAVFNDITEERRARLALEESEARYRTLVDASPVPILVHSEWKVVFANPAAVKALGGSSLQDVIGRPHLSFVDPELHDLAKKRIEDIYIRRTNVEAVELKYIRLDGSAMYVELAATSIDYEGKPAGQAVFKDITAERRARTALEESEARYRTLVDASPIPILVHSEWNIVFANPAAIKAVGGSSPEDMVGKPLLSFVHPDYHDISKKRIKDIYVNRVAVEPLELKYIRLDGSVMNIELAATSIDYEGKPAGQAVFKDITDRKVAEEALRQAHQRLSFHMENSPLILVEWDGKAKLSKWSDRAEKTFGWSADEVLGKTWTDWKFVHEDDLEYVQERVGELINGTASHNTISNRNYAKDGSIVYCEWHNSVLLDGAGSLVSILSMTQDVTQRVMTEEKLAEYRNYLEKMVKARTKQLEAAQEELIARERLAVLGQLTATVSHELRNPLGVIRSSSYYLRKKTDKSDERLQKHLNRIEQQVTLCDSIVNELLEYTRKGYIERVEEDLNVWLRQVLTQIAVPGGVKLKRNLSTRPLRLSFDPGKMRRVVNNIVDNALQAVTERREKTGAADPPYEPWVEVSASVQGESAILTISDNGIGLSEDVAKRAFDPFFTTRARGTGLGLAIVRKIVEEHGGSVSLNNQSDQGTTVTLTLPMN